MLKLCNYVKQCCNFRHAPVNVLILLRTVESNLNLKFMTYSTREVERGLNKLSDYLHRGMQNPQKIIF
jgi:hypothetical protein